jgi:hypothetical protein
VKKALYAGAAALVLSVAPAVAQTSTTTTTVDTTGSLTFTPAQETTIRQFVQRERVRPVTVRERIVVGATVPAEVELQPLPAEIVTEVPAVRPFRFFATDAGVVVVDPGTRRVVRVIGQ